MSLARLFLLSLALSVGRVTSQDACSGNPCLNGGTCVIGSNSGYTCLCLPAYTGTNCDVACVADITLVIDSSGSIRKANVGSTDNWVVMLDFVKTVISSFSVGITATRISLLKFSNSAQTIFHLNTHNDSGAMLADVDTISYDDGTTNTTGALRLADREHFTQANGDRDSVTNIIILITDGNPTKESPLTQEYMELEGYAQSIRDSGTYIIGVGIGDVNQTLFMSLVTQPFGTYYFNVTDFNGLSDILTQLIRTSCDIPGITTTTTTFNPFSSTTTRSGGGGGSDPICQLADLVFVLDASGSINDVNFNIIKSFVTGIIEEIDEVRQDWIRVGLQTFADGAQPMFQLNTYATRDEVLAAVAAVPYSRGRTNTAAALDYLSQTMFTNANGDRQEAPNIAVVLTDGGSNNKLETLSAAFAAKSAGIHIVVIAVGDWVDEEEVRALASFPYQSNIFSVEDAGSLPTISNTLNLLICNQQNECSSNPCRNGATCVDALDMYICICPPGFADVNCEKECRVGADIIFALDASGSIGLQNFQKQVDFVKEIVYGINFDRDSRMGLLTFASDAQVKFHLDEYTTRMEVLNAISLHYTGGTTNTASSRERVFAAMFGDSRMGLLTFASDAQVKFHLDEYTTRMEVLNAISLHYTGGTTNTASAINTINSEMFQQNRGDRNGYTNIAVIMTDGLSDDALLTWQEAMAARANGIEMIAVGVGSMVNMMELEGIASGPSTSNVLLVNDYDSLNLIASELIDATCNANDDCNPNPCQNGGQCIDRINGYQCICTDQWSGAVCDKGCSGKLDVIFIIDASGSIRIERFPYVIEYMVSIAEELEIREDKTRVGAVKFSDNAQIEFNLNEYVAKQDVLQALRRIRFVGGRTNTASALAMAMNNMYTQANGDREDAQNIIIVLTDGNSNINEENTVPNAIEARSMGAHIIVAAVGSDLNELELRGIASMPISDTLYMVPSMMSLQNIRMPVIEATCDDQDECTSGPCQNGGTCVDTYDRYFCVCQPDWSGEQCTRRCSRQMDVVFVLDISGSMDQVYDLVVAVTVEIVQGLPMSFSRARVGLVYYSDTAHIGFNLNKYSSKEDVLNAVAFRQAGGTTQTHAAFQLAYQQVFSSSGGDRSGVPNIMVVVTDGGSTNKAATQQEAANMRNNGIEVYAIALGDTPDMGEINGIASSPQSEHVILLPNENQVTQAASTFLDIICQ